MRGFTLVELLVSITLAAIISSALLGAFVTFIQYQIQGQEERAVLETVRFSIDDISRDIYFGREYSCGTVGGETKLPNQNGLEFCSCLSFIDQLGRQVKFREYNGSVEKRISLLNLNVNTCNETEHWIPISSNAVDVDNILFSLPEAGATQPWVGIEINTNYNIDNQPFTLKTKSRVTRRILEPEQSIASRFKVSTDVSKYLFGHYVGYNSSGACVNKSGDEFGEGNFDPCTQKLYPIESYLLDSLDMLVVTDNGLVFIIPEATVSEILKDYLTSTDGVINANQIINSAKLVQVQNSNSSALLFDDNTPKNIINIHVDGGNVAYAEGSDGSLFKLTISNSSVTPLRLFPGRTEGGGHIEDFTFSGSKKFALFRDDANALQFKIFSGDPVPSGAGVSIAAAGQEQQYSNAIQSIKRIYIDSIQFINNILHIWYFDVEEEEQAFIQEEIGESKHKESYPVFSFPIKSSSPSLVRCNGNKSICNSEKIFNNKISKFSTLSGDNTLNSFLRIKNSNAVVGLSSEGKIYMLGDVTNIDELQTPTLFEDITSNAESNRRGQFCGTLGIQNLYQYFTATHFSPISAGGTNKAFSFIAKVDKSISEDDTVSSTPEIFILWENSTLPAFPNECSNSIPVEYYKVVAHNFSFARLGNVTFKVPKP